MNTFILRWNPAISSYKINSHLDIVSHVRKMQFPNNFNWSVREWENLKKGDTFILLQVGTDADGIAMIGRFISSPYEEESWRGDGSKVHYADMEIFDAFDLSEQKEFRTAEFEKDFPKIKWHGGHSGEELDEKTSKKLFSKIYSSLKVQKNWHLNSDKDIILKNAPDDGKILLGFKKRFLSDKTKDNLLSLLFFMKDIEVFVPMNTIVDAEDENKILEMLERNELKAGVEWRPEHDIRLTPDILEDKEKNLFYPIFSTEKEIPEEYGKNFSIVPLSVITCIEMFKGMENLNAIVLDPWTKAFFIDSKLADVILDMAGEKEGDKK